MTEAAVPIKLYSKSSVEKDWKCPRSFYYAYEYDGKGIQEQSRGLALALGTALHDALAVIAFQTKDIQDSKPGEQVTPVDIDLIASTAFSQVRDPLVEAIPAEATPDARDFQTNFANEQGALVEGIIRGFYKHVWPKLMAEYSIWLIEEPLVYRHGTNLGMMSKADLVLESKLDGSKWYFEYKSTSSKKQEWITSWETAIQVHSSIKALQQAYPSEDFAGVIIQGLYKGYESYGRQNSPFCLVPETKVLKDDLTWVELGTIQEGDTLVGFDEYPQIRRGTTAKRDWRKARVEKLSRVKMDCVKITFEDGKVITCSKDHMWLTSQNVAGFNAATTKWTKTSELRPKNQYPTSPSRMSKMIDVWETDTTYNAGYVAGLLDGEGYVSHVETTRRGGEKYVSLGFSQKPGPVMDRMREAYDQLGLKYHGPYEPHTKTGHSASTLLVNRKADLLRLLGSIRPQRLLDKLDLEGLGTVTPIGRPIAVISVEDVGLKEVVTIQTSTRTFVAEGLPSHNCYAYVKYGQPPFTKDQFAYDYKAGWKKYPTWTMEGGTKDWVNKMPEEVLADQFPRTPPIFVNDDLIEAFFRQQETRQIEIQMAHEICKRDDVTLDAATYMLDKVFPQRFDQCQPAYGYDCSYRNLCHGPDVDPLDIGYIYRDTEHLAPFIEKLNENNNNPTSGST